jgi:hypothetical protein
LRSTQSIGGGVGHLAGGHVGVEGPLEVGLGPTAEPGDAADEREIEEEPEYRADDEEV